MRIFKERITDSYNDPEEWLLSSELWIKLAFPNKNNRYLLETKTSPYKNQLIWNKYIIKL